jgi:hypothetical protein
MSGRIYILFKSGKQISFGSEDTEEAMKLAWCVSATTNPAALKIQTINPTGTAIIEMSGVDSVWSEGS